MKVQVNTSNDIANKDALERWASDFLNGQLARFDQDLTSIEVQLTDENHGAKGGIDKRCMLEARLAGRAPVAVTNFAPDQNQAIRGAADKLAHALDHALGKLDRKLRERETIRRDPEVLEAVVPPQA
jgi:ribosome-associated translation inhibitor RaiA